MGVLFIASWLKGNGVVVVDGSVEDSATAEISRSQVLPAVVDCKLASQGVAVDPTQGCSGGGRLRYNKPRPQDGG